MMTLTEAQQSVSDFSSDEDGLPVLRRGRNANATSPPPPPPPPTSSVPASPVSTRSHSVSMFPEGR